MRVILLLGDQLSPAISSLRDARKDRDVVLMAEVAEEAGYADHHKQKLVLVFSAMRHFADELRAAGWRVLYRKLDDPDPAPSLERAARDALAQTGAKTLVLTEPGEWRLRDAVRRWALDFDAAIALRDDDRFFIRPAEFAAWAKGRRRFLMADFYRDMRRRTGLLMRRDAPEGGHWGYDEENRKPTRRDLFTPAPLSFAPDATTRAVIEMARKRFPDNIGRLDRFDWAVTRAQAEIARDRFFEELLPNFGDYQDAMLRDAPTLWHSALSPYLNLGLLDARDLCARAEAAYRRGAAPLNAAEGFIRQILGWREFVRGVYWMTMPGYRSLNALRARRPLPRFYWTGETDMACLADVIGQSLDRAYAHHIQRLMVAGNYAMLIGADPGETHRWYLGVYADAYEWVELPNTLGMALYADGGIVGSKPYIASGRYIDRMSDYCAGCRYNPASRIEADSCPFNALYWDFVARHERKFDGNPRMQATLALWRGMSAQEQADVRARAADVLAMLDP